MRRLHHKPIPLMIVVLASVFAVGVDSDPVANAGPAITSKPTSRDHRIALVVSQLLQRQHLSRMELDDEVSGRALGLFLESLDPRKLYFLQSDINEFAELRTRLDDLVKKGNVDPAFRIFKRFVERVDQRIPVIDELLEHGFDFTIDEHVSADSETRAYAKDRDALDDRWRRELKLQMLVQQASDKSQRLADAGDEGGAAIAIDEKMEPATRIRGRYHRLQARMERLESEKLIERFLDSIAKSFDPHTAYMSPSTLEQFTTAMSLNLEGIGAHLLETGDYTTITKIIDGGAASREANISIGDRILAVAQGTDGQWLDVVGMAVDGIATRVRGKPGTTVRLRLRKANHEVKEVILVRSRIELTRQRASGHVVPLQASDRANLTAGYLQLPGFYHDVEAVRRGDPNARSCSRDVQDLLEGFRDSAIDVVVLDLRDNGGGYLDEAIKIVGLFIDRGPVVQVRDSNGSVTVFDDPDSGVKWGGPLVVLTNRFSASASEIVAGAIQDYRRGIVVGDPQTHGKGTVQTPLDITRQLLGVGKHLPNYGALKITVQKYYLPSGGSTQVDGVAADVVLPSRETYESIGESELKYAMPNDEVAAARHERYAMLSTEVIDQIKEASRRRVGESEGFARITSQMNLIRERQEQSQVSIEKTKFDAARAQWDNDDDRHGGENTSSEDEEFPRNDYENEVLEIVRDYVDELVSRNVANVG